MKWKLQGYPDGEDKSYITLERYDDKWFVSTAHDCANCEIKSNCPMEGYMNELHTPKTTEELQAFIEKTKQAVRDVPIGTGLKDGNGASTNDLFSLLSAMSSMVLLLGYGMTTAEKLGFPTSNSAATSTPEPPKHEKVELSDKEKDMWEKLKKDMMDKGVLKEDGSEN